MSKQQAVAEVFDSKLTPLGPGFSVQRAFPHARRRTVGPWCFFDYFGPARMDSTSAGVPPHPHIGIQTVTWLIEGESLHRDSLGTEQVIRTGELNVMTAGRGISHSEQPTPDTIMHGVQLWVALPPEAASMEPAFEYHARVPSTAIGHGIATVIAGSFAGQTSPARHHSPIVGVDLLFDSAGATEVPLDVDFEYAVVPLTGSFDWEGEALDKQRWLYLPPGSERVTLRTSAGARLMLVGGAPCDPIIIWWNFVARTSAELEAARADWVARRRFGVVEGWGATRLTAPQLTPNLVAR